MITNLKRIKTYTDSEGADWHIYTLRDTDDKYKYSEYWIQKKGYGIMEMVFGVPRAEEDYTRQVEDFIESVKNEENWS